MRIASADNPLTARVMVNRLWGHLIGRPLVDSSSDFGVRTQPPKVPEVSRRTVRRFFATLEYQTYDSPYRAIANLSSKLPRRPLTRCAKDPENRWLCRGNRRRRDFESLRDSLLVAADSLERTVGGKSSKSHLDTPAPRRTIYAKIDRQNLPPIFRTFDFASPDTHSAGRYFTTVPQQALYLINSKQIIDLAARTAAAAKRDAATSDTKDPVESLFRRILNRSPSPQQREWANDFLRQPASPLPPSIDPRGLWSYGTASLDDDDSRLENFRPFANFRNGQWQVAKEFPTQGPLAYASLGQENGHPGEGQGGAVVRRFTSPLTGNVRITGMMGHLAEQGDGVRTQIWVGDRSVFDNIQKSNRRPYGPLTAKIQQGQHIDFVASAGATMNHDTFFWRMRISVSDGVGHTLETESTHDFSGPIEAVHHKTLARFSQLAHVLLMSNEFAFVD